MIVDIHTHIFPPRFIEARERLAASDPVFAEMYADPRAKMATADDLLASMEGARVDVSVACGFWWRDRGLAEEHAAYIIDAAGRAGGRLVPFVPLPPDALPERAAGAGEVRVTDPAELTAGTRPVLVHCSEETGHEYPGKHGGLTPGALWRYLEAQPEARVIAAHWGGGFPFAALMPEVSEVIASGRVVFDTAASSLLYGPGVFALGITLVGVEAICWGSDYPLRGQAADRALVAGALASDEERAAVLGGNAARFLGLEG